MFINHALQQGVFPTAFKTVLVKKSSLDPSTPSNYRPISNLLNSSKTLEKLVFVQLNSSLNSSNKLEMFQANQNGDSPSKSSQ